MNKLGILPPTIVLEPLLREWLLEDIGRGDRTTQALLDGEEGQANWVAKADGVIAGLPIAAKVFNLLNEKSILCQLWLKAKVEHEETLLLKSMDL